MIPKHANERGSSMVIALLILLVVTLLGRALYTMIKSLSYESVYQARLAQSHTIAEAGLEDAMLQLYTDSSWRTGYTKKAFGGGSYTVTLSSANPPVMTSTGYSASVPLLGTAKTQVTATAQITTSTTTVCAQIARTSKIFLQGYSDAYDSSVNTAPSSFASGGTLCSNNQVQIQTNPGMGVNGDVYYGVGPAPNASYVTGKIALSTTTVTVSNHDGSAYSLLNNDLLGILPLLSFNVLTGQLNLSSGANVTISPGIYYLNGMTINSGATLTANTASGSVIIYLNGSMSNNGTIVNTSKIPGRFAVYPQGSNTITLQSSSSSFYGIVEGPNATVFASQVVYGHLWAASLNITANIHYDSSGSSSGNSTPTHVDWKPTTWSALP